MTNKTLPETPTGQPLGDTGDGKTGVPADEQGLSNRPGDRDQELRDEKPESGPKTTSKD